MGVLVTTDARGRATLGERDTSYRVTTLDGGVLLLEPVEVMTRSEMALLRNPEALARINEGMARRAEATPRRRRTPRR